MVHPSRSTAGRLLISQPHLDDPNFDRTIIFMIEHNDEGALGVVLNRPTDLRIEEVLADWRNLAAAPAVLHVGGPVSQTSVLGLGRRAPDGFVPGMTEIIGGTGTIDLNVDVDLLMGELVEVRLFAGYSGWGAGQLDWELESESWYVVDAIEDDVFDHDPSTLWQRVLGRQPDRLALLKHLPPDVSVN